MGTMITYGSYIRKQDKLHTTAFSVAATDAMVAILAGVAIFPAVFAFGIIPSVGEGLAFITLPNIFQQMAGGYIWANLFFLLLIIASITSTISVLEVVVAFMVEELGIRRHHSTLIAAGSITFLGLFCTLSQGPYPNLKLFGLNLFELMNYTTANILLPLGGLMIVIFVGWFMGKRNVKDEVTNSGRVKSTLFPLYIFLVRYLAPIAIIIVFLQGLGILKF
jgi:NSS family neurotransmitter:Na+ symporter